MIRFAGVSVLHCATIPRSAFVRVPANGCEGNKEKAWRHNREGKGSFKFLHPKGFFLKKKKREKAR